MAGKIYQDQPITLETAFTDDDGVVVITGGSVVYYYFFPGNTTSTPDGNVSGSIVDGAAGTATGELPAALNTAARAGQWKIQARVTISGDTFAENTSSFYTYVFGA